MANDLNSIKSNAVLISKATRYINYSVPFCVLFAGLSVFFAVTQVKDLIDSGSQAHVIATQKSTPKIVKKELDEAAYNDAVKVISQNNPNVKVTVDEDHTSLNIAATSGEHLPDWVYLLSTLQSYRPGLVWKAKSICVNTCKNKMPVEAHISAYTQTIETGK